MDPTDPGIAGGTGTAPDAGAAGRADGDDRNQVLLAGRVSGTPERRVLPSGDEVVHLRLVVGRPDGGSDTLPVQVGPGPAPGRRARAGQVGRRELAAAARLADGSRIEVAGRLHRRWWATPAGRRSRVEVVTGSIGRASS